MHLPLLFCIFAATVSAVPLNINLGAYSPALVVGDGEISFDSTQKASELMETLATGAATAGQGAPPANEAGTPPPAAPPLPEKARGNPAEALAVPPPNVRAPSKRELDDGMGELDLVSAAAQWIKRDIAGFKEALSFAERAMQNQPKVELGTGAGGSGVGVIVNGGLNVPANSAANGAPPPGGAAAKVKRSLDTEVDESEMTAAPKMTLVAITEV
ncbi:hypothetical protein K432DRAFT_128346 [Lepidopterella palustris CBS 459.81]|uniref:Uncharacterized protein n=1 Tax=Lepidopterella palustris CBS 459.81 TaxID=1314670 RepID=A0A8E2EIA6_9PEZI|nr:hypothetical protein K432DRAFT_128346 [Lepidopterella palustris CBS 459.81]